MKIEQKIVTGAEADYFHQLEKEENIRKARRRMAKYNGSYEAAKGDFEGAILARDEWNANPF